MTSPAPPPGDGDEILRQVREWKAKPLRFSCLGLSGTIWLILVALTLAVFWYLRHS
jgi:hypothetical protein